MRARYLADKSALARLAHPAVAAWLEPRVLDGEVARCSIIDLELLFSARSHKDFVSIRNDRVLGFELVETTQSDFERAVTVMEALARSGHHRAVAIPDLIIAATPSGPVSSSFTTTRISTVLPKSLDSRSAGWPRKARSDDDPTTLVRQPRGVILSGDNLPAQN